MRTVMLLRRRPDAETEPLVRLTVPEPGQPATFEILIPELREGLERTITEGAPDGHGHLLTLEDGEAYLDALLSYYRGSRFWAREVKPGDVA